MTFRYRYRKQIFLCIIVILILIGTGTSIFFLLPKEEKSQKGKMIIAKNIQKTSNNKKSIEKKEEKKEENKTIIKIDIKGEVVNPGIYEFEDNSRVIDQTTPNMIQRISGIFERNPLISKEI